MESMGDLPERSRQYAGAIRVAATQLAHSIDDVLDMAQIDAGEMALEIEDIRVSDLLLNAQERALKDAQLGAVTLSAEAAPAEVRIRVEDTGRGIPYHLQAHVFDRFVKRERGGPGVGLALVKALVELHGGWAEVESEPGKGAAFILHLPLEATGVAAAPELRLG
jgi:signal transduction histidine kinase